MPRDVTNPQRSTGLLGTLMVQRTQIVFFPSDVTAWMGDQQQMAIARIIRLRLVLIPAVDMPIPSASPLAVAGECNALHHLLLLSLNNVAVTALH